MKIITLLLLISFLLLKNVNAQDFIVPENYQLTSKEDYTKYEKDVINATNWLLATPLNEQTEKRKEVSAFVVKWINGSPTVNVELNPTIMDLKSS